MPIAPLVADDDTDLAGWQAGTQATFLNMVSAEIRRYCGWHIAPSVSVTEQRRWFGGDGLIMLPSTFVTSIESVTIDGQVLVEGRDYFWDEPKPWIRRRWGLRRAHPYALVSYTHGYSETPIDVKAVLAEVLATAMEVPASNATHIQTMQYTFQLNPAVGVTLSPDQKNRLGRYKITSFGLPAAAPGGLGASDWRAG
jgi:hypothetical protein